MIESSNNENVSIITINKPKVNAIDNNMLDMLKKVINDAEIDETTNVILITGSGSFFSFGLDIPAGMSKPKEKKLPDPVISITFVVSSISASLITFLSISSILLSIAFTFGLLIVIMDTFSLLLDSIIFYPYPLFDKLSFEYI